MAEEKTLTLSVDGVCNNASELFMSGTLCGKAMLLSLKESGWLPADRWNFEGFEEINPVPDGHFRCKTMIAGALAIYLDVIVDRGIDETASQTERKNLIERVNNLFNIFLKVVSKENGENPVDFDPFSHDEYLKGVQIKESARTEYKERVAKLFSTFIEMQKDWNCDEVVGFNAWGYLASPDDFLETGNFEREKKEYITSGQWMQNCDKNIRNVLRAIITVN